MFVTGKLLTKAVFFCCLVVPQIALSDEAPTHCLVDDAVVPYDTYCKGSDVLLRVAEDKKRFWIEGKAKKAIDAGLSFCQSQEFRYDKLRYQYIVDGGYFFDSQLAASCDFSEQKPLTPIGLKQLQNRKISLSPSKVAAAVAEWMEFRTPGAAPRKGPFTFVVPTGGPVRKDTESGEWLYKSYLLYPIQYAFYDTIPFYKGELFVKVEIMPSPPKQNSEGLWIATPSIKYGEEGNTIVKMKVLMGSELSTQPEIYNKFFKEILDAAFVESIQFEPFIVE